MWQARKLRRALIIGVVLAVSIASLAIAINAYIVISTRGKSHDTVAAAPRAQTAIVLGALVMPDGTMSAMLADRVSRGAELYRAGKVSRVLVSGDHGRWAYDEVNTMRKALERQGVPPNAIFTDHAGFNTWSTMVRARKVFRVSSAIVVTQGFHMARALYLARAAGVPAHGVTADIQPYGRQQAVSTVRELFARLKAAGQAATNSAVILGPPVPITGDGRASWGPQRPPS